MQIYTCKYAKHFENYYIDSCQGCPQVRFEHDRWRIPTNPVVEAIKKQITKEEIMTYTELKNGLDRAKDTPKKPAANPLDISRVIFNDPATIVIWKDGSKTIVKCQEGDTYSKETGLALCIAKKALGNQPNFNNVFRKWISEE